MILFAVLYHLVALWPIVAAVHAAQLLIAS